MAKSKRISIMLSSRCNTQFPNDATGKSLTEIRKELQKEIQGEKLLGHQLFDVWINEDSPPVGHDADSWEACLAQVRDCDILIVISNGEAGWAKTAGDIGICHAEYAEGLLTTQAKVRVVALPNVTNKKGEEGERNRRFQEYLSQISPFHGGEAKTIDDLKKRVRDAINEALISLTQRGVAAFGSSKFNKGQALDWSRMNFRQRKSAMEKVLRDSMVTYKGAQAADAGVNLLVGETSILTVIHAIPAAFTIAAARELVGRPFLQDHELASSLKKAAGPLHIIACHKSATETQASNLLGFPDATIVSGEFGVYVADNTQKVQFAFLTNCRDSTHTRHAFQRFMEWLEQSGEASQLAARALSRARIVNVIARENNEKKGK